MFAREDIAGRMQLIIATAAETISKWSFAVNSANNSEELQHIVKQVAK